MHVNGESAASGVRGHGQIDWIAGFILQMDGEIMGDIRGENERRALRGENQ